MVMVLTVMTPCARFYFHATGAMPAAIPDRLSDKPHSALRAGGVNQRAARPVIPAQGEAQV
jgi:hypothetical protein